MWGRRPAPVVVPAAELPALFPFDEGPGIRVPGRETAGYYIGTTVVYRGRLALEQLASVPNASGAERLALIESVQGVFAVARELLELDVELIKASNDELESVFNERYQWNSNDYSYVRRSGNYAYETLHYDRDHIAKSQRQARDWAEQHVPESNLPSFLALLKRRAELRAAAFSGLQGIVTLQEQIAEAERKSKIIDAVAQLDPELGLNGRTELALENLASTQLAIEAVNQGLDEAYGIAISAHPELNA
jgi:hypothetical protein